MVVAAIVIFFFALYSTIKSAIDDSEYAQNLKKITHMLEGWHQDRQKEKLAKLAAELNSLKEKREDNHCPGCRYVLYPDDQYCPSCGLLVREKQKETMPKRTQNRQREEN